MSGGSPRRTRRQTLRRQAKERKISALALAQNIAGTGLGTLLGRPKDRKAKD